ncbi:hypothetical protein OGR47_12495 [Methylocystis sp. MJC1]|jgi:hypothetical protein|uniref:hypothetical protein n=1 Tax=Methylocystis sp. MJC1 TaxID=2654282 RepID=UPI001FEEB073|nr:hypothetical protein [Methylocystis sp. MJC1]UZX10728.1 hypothetical protein OGR47_12495 [Methylocystis sp. MJC1]
MSGAALTPAGAQLALPGAVAPTPEGTLTSPGGKPKKKLSSGEMGQARGPVVMPKAPSEDTIVGKTLQLDGVGSAIEFSRIGSDLEVAKLTLSGDRLSRSGEECRVEIAGMPLKLTRRDSGSGLRRYQLLSLPACPFTLDVLDGAILVTNEGKACEIREADCRADPSGLWGMAETEFDPKKAEDMLGARAKVEKDVRADFRELYERNKKDKLVRSFVVKEQAGFSSWREEVCRSYAKESDFGYCALRLTEARTIALGAQLASGVKLPEGYAEAAAAEEAATKAKGKR